MFKIWVQLPHIVEEIVTSLLTILACAARPAPVFLALMLKTRGRVASKIIWEALPRSSQDKVVKDHRIRRRRMSSNRFQPTIVTWRRPLEIFRILGNCPRRTLPPRGKTLARLPTPRCSVATKMRSSLQIAATHMRIRANSRRASRRWTWARTEAIRERAATLLAIYRTMAVLMGRTWSTQNCKINRQFWTNLLIKKRSTMRKLKGWRRRTISSSSFWRIVRNCTFRSSMSQSNKAPVWVY